jgi:hypothetical protein
MLSLAARGYRVGGDDVALLEPRSVTIRPLPRCFHLDARSRRLLRQAGLSMPEAALRYAFLTPADLGMPRTPAAPVRRIIFLGLGDNGAPKLTELSQAETIARLLSQTPPGAGSVTEVLAALRPLVGAAGCYHVLRSSLSETTDAVAALLGPP